ncbi:MAG: hypothetical protein J6A59_15160 [Lachnospiraceae bacterium]|nr:hypothetical protein [Lachnospiraceae bacterium]
MSRSIGLKHTSLKREYGQLPKLNRKKCGAKKYKAFTDEVIYFWDYTPPIDDINACYEDFRHNGFDLLYFTNSVVQNGRYKCNTSGSEQMLELTYKQNYERYGFGVGAVLIPSVVIYNTYDECYYGLCNYGGSLCDYLHGECIITKYDEFGHLISSRTAYIQGNKFIKEKSTCNKNLGEFIENAAKLFNDSPYQLLYEQRNKIEKLSKENEELKRICCKNIDYDF